jgi:hypothetical protein
MLANRCHDCPDVGHTTLQIHRKTSLFYALLLCIWPSSHYFSYIISELALLLAENHP